ncbi:alpha/beta-hydrolase [Macrolepiota fuliginosa MF-IS2]|uniref:Alpha/beta-hydrolase n=1 Tax=Macrolepiota fuliginosa MF-IS2 TaxID=1400762 RepID=A0A9P5XNY5_9AGAR|nr:alpha/beta-hydrolase [Macrolepiota fuliginosa MF-IS2]
MAASERATTKIYIPHPDEPDLSICGILEQHAPRQDTMGRKLVLILHGTMGHKDYLFQRRLADRFPMDSFRFDFRGNYETGGTWKQGALDEDIQDLNAVVAYLKSTYGYKIELIVGHSRGSLVAFRWIATTEDGRNVPAFVNVSGRYRMRKILETPAAKVWQESFEKQGYFEWHITVARQAVVARIHPHDVEQFCAWDTSIVWEQFPKETDVLTLHGLADKTVPPYDAVIYARALSRRSPGTHTLHLMEDADHNFTKRQDDVVEAILQWWDARQRDELQTGIWLTEIRENTAKL